MISPKNFYETLKENNINFFTGVPDSSLKYFTSYLSDNIDEKNHIIAANEGNAVAIATGHYLATENPALVYMQNSGQGNAVNPLTSLTDPEVYSIPMILLIGWRGEPGKKDEPQHIKQGKITLELLKTLGIPYTILNEDLTDTKEIVGNAIKISREKHMPFALVAKMGIFEEYHLEKSTDNPYQLTREDAIKLAIDNLSQDDIIISTTGKISRELFEYREELNQDHSQDFLTVGSMGHASSIALGIALSKPHRNIFCFDGDGAAIMHAGILGIIGQNKPENFKHIIFNNGAHDSVGGQPTTGFNINLTEIAKQSGYKTTMVATTIQEVNDKITILKQSIGPAFLEIRVKRGARRDLGRPTKTPLENKEAFIDNLKK